MIRTLAKSLAVVLLVSLVACGGSSGTTTTTGGGCLATCFSSPAGTMPVLCMPTFGANVPVMASDYDYVLTLLNNIRTARGLTALVRTAALDTFAGNASNLLMMNNIPHAYFSANSAGDPAFTGARAENQGSPTGWAPNTTTVEIDEIVNCFMAEETAPAGSVKGHFEAIVCPCFAKIGVGLVKDGAGQLFLTIDFSE